ncbi:MAG: Rieske 2Fe-2S domain-containing protein [Aliifodinibius sp.]|nr:Rieske 2Fe-2S domain-containing protein [Fodinibius sp.]
MKQNESANNSRNEKNTNDSAESGLQEKAEALPGIAINRRDFLFRIGVGALSITAAGSGLVTLDFLWPDVVKQPPSKFKVGTPQDYPKNSVTMLPDQNVFVVRSVEGYFYAMSAICPHLGCITKWWKDLGEIRCPCHGSRFTMNGERIAGPAPRGLWHVKIELNSRGTLLVDNEQNVDKDYILKV